MAMATVEKIEGRLMVAVSDELQEELQLVEGEPVTLARDTDALAFGKTRRYTLEQLIAEHETIKDQLEEDRAWLDAPRVGRELS